MSFASLIQSALLAVPDELRGTCTLSQKKGVGTYDKTTETWSGGTPTVTKGNIPCVVSALRPDRAVPPGFSREKIREVFVAAADCGSIVPEDLNTTCTLGAAVLRIASVLPVIPNGVDAIGYTLLVATP